MAASSKAAPICGSATAIAGVGPTRGGAANALTVAVEARRARHSRRVGE